MVLILVAFTSSLLAAASRTMTSSALAAATFSKVMRADELGRTAEDLVIFWASAEDRADKRGGAFVAHFSDAEVFIEYVSESARIDINNARPELIVALFRALGADLKQAFDLAPRIAASRLAVVSLEPSHFDHLAAIGPAWSAPQDLIDAAAPALTVASGAARVNPLIADRWVIAALIDSNGLRVDQFLARRQLGFASEAEALDALAPEKKSDVGFDAAPVYRARARVVI